MVGQIGTRSSNQYSSSNLMRILRTLVEERRWHSRRPREHGEEEIEGPNHPASSSKLGRWSPGTPPKPALLLECCVEKKAALFRRALHSIFQAVIKETR